ncbi:MAG TPA: endolytic transglycosylase MltG [Chitinivibrionales bacterium]|nr:endolytic transglycosylase MltG [Chitinivibrionales bacterium]
MKNPIFRALYRTWLTGALFFLAALGYAFYAALWLYRFVLTYKKLFLLLLVFTLVAAAAAGYVFGPLHARGKQVEFTIEKGAPLHDIAAALKRERVIPSSKALIVWMKLAGTEKKIQAGRASFFEGEGVAAAASQLLHAEPIELVLTVPEGLTLRQTAEIVARTLKVDSAAFVKACEDSAVARACGINEPTLEGYLFPDTYRLPPAITAEDIVKRMTEHFNEKYAAIAQPPDAGAALTRHEAVILASIIEKEAAVAAERPLISGVFHNRLKKGIPLGADPTTRYILGKFSGPLHVSELAVQSPYNTRLHAGLPPGPICSPGLASLTAALNPEQTKMLYFVAKWDGSGSHDFSMTNAEHARKKEEIVRSNEKRKSLAVKKKAEE